jgi:predicted DNA-binding transcriptional regulator YafY
MPSSASRLITLILLMQDQPNRKAAELAGKLGVSVRTLHRYFGMLDEMGIPIYSERGPHGGFSLVRGYKMPPLVLTPEEAAAVTLGTGLVGEMWGELYRDAAEGALAKLDRLLPDEQRAEIAWARRSLVATGLNRAEMDTLVPRLELLRAALRGGRAVYMAFRGGSSAEVTRRELDPYALVHRWGWWYAVGYCHLRQEVRSFRVDRIVALELLERVFQPPADFDIRAYLEADLRAQTPLRARLCFTAQAAPRALANRASWEQVDEQPDGAVCVTLVSPDLQWAASSVLAYGPGVRVLDPPELRAAVKTWALEIAGLNDEAESNHLE